MFRSFFKSEPITELTPSEAHHRAERGEILLVDVREPKEWADARIPGAVSAPLSRLADQVGQLPSDKPIVFYCLGGKRSSAAIGIARKLGLPHSTHVAGGITAWKAASLPVTSG